ncbi:hypothetical protein L6452_36827 [Arctium lappa]|uniref:Uncharacterized protein n=1 Tax=Arctium lappa TaxID=4217 RepID=A0ACB8Y0P1_ARCLA|nr:hypothetical protein L6452_36827 [Arctium lappa]
MKTLVLMWVLLLMFSVTTSDTNSNTSETYTLIKASNLAKPDCPSQCGDVIVPYPFGIGSNCSIGPGFDVYCNMSTLPPKASFSEADYASIKRISDSTLRISNMVSSRCYSPDGEIRGGFNFSPNFSNLPYTISEINKLTVIGCNEYAWVTSRTESTGCLVICYKQENTLVGDECSGHACCQSSLPENINYYVTRFYALQESNLTNNGSLNNIITRPLLGEVLGMSSRESLNPCTYAFVGDADAFKFNGRTDLDDTSLRKKIEDTVPIVLEWAIGDLNCTEAEATNGSACQSNSKCVNSPRETGGYRCICDEGYEGNPYLSPGCQDIDECKDVEAFPCHGTCVNIPGNYTCKCKQGYSGDAKIKDGCSREIPVLQLALGIGLGFPAILTGISVLYFTAKKRKLVKLREKFFEQNGGVLLQDKLKTKGGVGIGSMRIFRVEELEAATENFAEDRILGKGGNGIVYKGTLPDKCVVAIKKSQRLDQGQREQFINEMVILTQINHQNIVQLLGCCLETDIPLLVYEFVSNDTLNRHIHNQTSGLGRLSWNNRLRIAHESAGALAYLHTDARMSIIHRDVKSTNILLDDNYTAKIADFGASRLVPLGHDQVTTLVQGTLGYLDPEYFHTGQLTDKSDVYSFGVVLAELLTGKKPINIERCLDERNLATYFVNAMKENQLLDILEHQVVNEATDEQLKATCYLACRCLNIASERRPSMKEVTMELETLRKFRKHPWDCQDMKYNEMSSLMIEGEEVDLYTVPFIDNSDTFGEYSSSSIKRKDIML